MGEPVEDASAELQISITVDPDARTITIQAVSYTHLTLPTIYSV